MTKYRDVEILRFPCTVDIGSDAESTSIVCHAIINKLVSHLPDVEFEDDTQRAEIPYELPTP